MKLEGLFTLAQAMRALESERGNLPTWTHTLLARPRVEGNDLVVLYEVHNFTPGEPVPEDHIVMSRARVHRYTVRQPALDDYQRAQFERAMWELFVRNGWHTFDTDTDPENADRNELFWRDANGMYGVIQLNAAWYGWLSARGMRA